LVAGIAPWGTAQILPGDALLRQGVLPGKLRKHLGQGLIHTAERRLCRQLLSRQDIVHRQRLRDKALLMAKVVCLDDFGQVMGQRLKCLLTVVWFHCLASIRDDQRPKSRATRIWGAHKDLLERHRATDVALNVEPASPVN
jgi:hypothetical protein